MLQGHVKHVTEVHNWLSHIIFEVDGRSKSFPWAFLTMEVLTRHLWTFSSEEVSDKFFALSPEVETLRGINFQFLKDCTKENFCLSCSQLRKLKYWGCWENFVNVEAKINGKSLKAVHKMNRNLRTWFLQFLGILFSFSFETTEDKVFFIRRGSFYFLQWK